MEFKAELEKNFPKYSRYKYRSWNLLHLQKYQTMHLFILDDFCRNIFPIISISYESFSILFCEVNRTPDIFSSADTWNTHDTLIKLERKIACKFSAFFCFFFQQLLFCCLQIVNSIRDAKLSHFHFTKRSDRRGRYLNEIAFVAGDQSCRCSFISGQNNFAGKRGERSTPKFALKWYNSNLPKFIETPIADFDQPLNSRVERETTTEQTAPMQFLKYSVHRLYSSAGYCNARSNVFHTFVSNDCSAEAWIFNKRKKKTKVSRVSRKFYFGKIYVKIE